MREKLQDYLRPLRAQRGGGRLLTIGLLASMLVALTYSVCCVILSNSYVDFMLMRAGISPTDPEHSIIAATGYVFVYVRLLGSVFIALSGAKKLKILATQAERSYSVIAISSLLGVIAYGYLLTISSPFWIRIFQSLQVTFMCAVFCVAVTQALSSRRKLKSTAPDT